MSERPVVLVVAKDQELVDLLVRSLKARNLAAFGTAVIGDGIRSTELLRPTVVVVDPTSEECFALLDDLSGGWQSIGLVAIAESEVAASRARDIGIDEVVMGDDVNAVVNAVIELLQKRSDFPARRAGTRILVVDDEPGIVDILSGVLGRRGYEVIGAGTGTEALEIADRDPGIELVLLDVILPDKGGVDTLRELKQRHPALTVILMSAIADSEIAHHAVRLGAFDYVVKPFDIDELEGRIIAGLAAEEFHHLPWWRRFTDG